MFVLQVDLNDVNRIDIAFDGADEVDAAMNLIKVQTQDFPMKNLADANKLWQKLNSYQVWVGAQGLCKNGTHV